MVITQDALIGLLVICGILLAIGSRGSAIKDLGLATAAAFIYLGIFFPWMLADLARDFGLIG